MVVDSNAMARARRSLEGLSLGDAFGELYFWMYPKLSAGSDLPSGPWQWTDDTHMALSVVETLGAYGHIDQDALASAFTRRFRKNPDRGYGRGAARLLAALAAGADWRESSPKLFHGGSYGNGAAMRAAPIGAYFGGDPERAANEGRLSALVTHAHPEGQAGAIAVVAAASLSSRIGCSEGNAFLEGVAAFTPQSEVRERLLMAREFPADVPLDAVRALGSGQRVSAQDTVPFCVWTAAHQLHDYEAAMWTALSGLGDCDTVCAIVGGIVAMSAPELPSAWLSRREALPDLFDNFN
jgi:ADP-ribosylglycohydrolase